MVTYGARQKGCPYRDLAQKKKHFSSNDWLSKPVKSRVSESPRDNVFEKPCALRALRAPEKFFNFSLSVSPKLSKYKLQWHTLYCRVSELLPSRWTFLKTTCAPRDNGGGNSETLVKSEFSGHKSDLSDIFFIDILFEYDVCSFERSVVFF